MYVLGYSYSGCRAQQLHAAADLSVALGVLGYPQTGRRYMYVGEKRLGAFGQVFLVITSDTGPVESILPLTHTLSLCLPVHVQHGHEGFLTPWSYTADSDSSLVMDEWQATHHLFSEHILS